MRITSKGQVNILADSASALGWCPTRKSISNSTAASFASCRRDRPDRMGETAVWSRTYGAVAMCHAHRSHHGPDARGMTDGGQCGECLDERPKSKSSVDCILC